MNRSLFGAAACALVAWSAAGQDAPKLTARELFYTPLAAASKEPPAAPVTPKPPSAKPVKRTPVASAPKATPEAPPASSPQPHPEPAREPAGNLHVIPVSAAAHPPLALRYSLLRRTSGDEYREAAADSVFRSGDKLKVAVRSNDDGFLYIVQRGSSNSWNVLFPNAQIDAGDNRIQGNQTYTIPSNARFTFDEQAGTERLFVVLARKPVDDLEKLIYDVSGRNPRPASATPETGGSKMMIAQNRLEDAVVRRLRDNIQSRDLVFEKVDDDTPGERKEKAVYVATQDRSPNARVVAEISLRHE